jgi:MFS family permease
MGKPSARIGQMRDKTTATNNIFSTFRMLKGNTRASVICEPLWGIPYVLFNFYLSLYMKELGVTDQQLGYLISIGYVAGVFLSLISGALTDRFGRKRTTWIFDFISWPVAVIIYLISNSFLLFALATLINSFGRIVGVSWNLMVIEDADNEQRVSAFNLLNIINIATGIIIPLAGLLVSAYGVVISERIFLIYASISMTIMIVVRNRMYRETAVGQHILDERKKNPVKISLKSMLPFKSAAVFRNNPKAIVGALVYILFFIYIPLGTFSSLFFAPFMTEVLGLDKSSISLLGGVYSGVMLLIFVFVIPFISKLNNTRNMQFGLVIQVISIILLIMIPAGSMIATVLCIGAYAAGFGIYKPFVDSMFAEVSEGRERAGIYSLINTVTCIVTALIGFASGSIYRYEPRLIYVLSIIILVISFILLAAYYKLKKKDTAAQMTEQGK